MSETYLKPFLGEESSTTNKYTDATMGVKLSHQPHKVHSMRWFMMFLFVMCTVCSTMQTIQYSIIANVVVDFYGVSYQAVDWTVMIFMVFYLPCNILGVYIIQKIGVRISVIISILGACLAMWIKVASVDPRRFWVLLLGQGVVAVFQLLILPLPTQVAATWFGKKEVGLASSIALSAVQIGVALGFVLPPLLVKLDEDKTVVAYNMYVLNIGLAILCTITCLLTICFYKNEPPPFNKEHEVQVHSSTFTESTKRLFKNPTYVILLVAYSISGGIYNGIITLLNQVVLHYFPDAAEDAGRIGMIMLLTAIIGSTVSGFCLDRFRQLKLTIVIVFALFLLGYGLFMLTLAYSISAVYVSSFLLGMFMAAANTVGLQLSAELTEPEPKSISAGYFLAVAEAMGIAIIYTYSSIFYKYDAIWANVMTCCNLLVACLLVLFMPLHVATDQHEPPINRDN